MLLMFTVFVSHSFTGFYRCLFLLWSCWILVPLSWLVWKMAGMSQHRLGLTFKHAWALCLLWILSHVCINAVLDVGGVPGAAPVRSILPHDWWLQAARGERVVVIWPSIQPPWSPDANQPEQWIHTCLPSVSWLCAPGMCTGGNSIQVLQWLTPVARERRSDNILNLPNIWLKKLVSKSVIEHSHAFVSSFFLCTPMHAIIAHRMSHLFTCNIYIYSVFHWSC